MSRDWRITGVIEGEIATALDRIQEYDELHVPSVLIIPEADLIHIHSLFRSSSIICEGLYDDARSGNHDKHMKVYAVAERSFMPPSSGHINGVIAAALEQEAGVFPFSATFDGDYVFKESSDRLYYIDERIGSAMLLRNVPVTIRGKYIFGYNQGKDKCVEDIVMDTSEVSQFFDSIPIIQQQ